MYLTDIILRLATLRGGGSGFKNQAVIFAANADNVTRLGKVERFFNLVFVENKASPNGENGDAFNQPI
jgi:hypothetical protein